MSTERSQTKQSESSSRGIKQILDSEDPQEIRALFAFNSTNSEKEILLKFNLWCRKLYPNFYEFKDAPYHREIDRRNLLNYMGIQSPFVDIAFRGAAKTTRTKLFVAFYIANDEEHRRQYIKVLSADIANAKQIVTDVYNLLVRPSVAYFYPEIFQKTIEKRQETMATFTTSTGIKMQADSVGTDQRGDIQEAARPDFIWFDDFETRKTLRSAVTTQAIWDNMEEAKNGLSIDGAALYNCNYLSERGNVHKLVEKFPEETLITPIKGSVEDNKHIDGPPTWPAAYTPAMVEKKLADADDPAGEYLCVPSAGADILFDRSTLDKQEVKKPVRTISDFKIFHLYDPSHRFGSGHDVGGGVGLDSSTSVFIDFSSFPSRVVATYKSNLIKPNVFGDEIKSQGDRFGACIVAVENNKFDACIERLRTLRYENMYFQEQSATRVGPAPRVKTLGWNTNYDTKSKMLYRLKKAVEDGHLELSDADLINELRSYTRDDLMDKDIDPRLTTRHFDLLMAAAIAYQMKDFAQTANEMAGDGFKQGDYERSGLED